MKFLVDLDVAPAVGVARGGYDARIFTVVIEERGLDRDDVPFAGLCRGNGWRCVCDIRENFLTPYVRRAHTRRLISSQLNRSGKRAQKQILNAAVRVSNFRDGAALFQV